MNEKLKKILESIKAKTEERDGLLAKEGFDKDDATKARALNTDIEALQAQYELTQKAEEGKSWGNQPANAIPLPGAAGTKGATMLGMTPAGHTEIDFDRHGNMSIEQIGAGVYGVKTWQAISSKGYAESFMKYLRKGERALSSAELKDLEEGLDTQGGYLAPPEMIARIIQRRPTPTRVAGLVSNITTSRSAITIPKVNYSADDIYTTGFRVTWTGENPASDSEMDIDDSNLFGEHRIEVYTAMMATAITNDMVEDAAFDLQGWLVSKFNETVDLLSDNMVINGSGINQPRGILVAPGTTGEPDIVVTGSAAAMTSDGIINHAYALPEQYDENARFLFNKTGTGKAIATLKDSDNNYLFSNELGNRGLASARPSLLVGYPFLYSGFMPNPAANAYPSVFGDLSGYLRALRLGLSIQVLRETRARRNQLELVGRLRIGGKTVEPWKLKVQKCST